MLRVEQQRHYPRDRQDVARYLVARGCRTDILMAAALGDVDLVRRHLDADAGCIRTSVSEEWFPKQDPRAGGTVYIWKLGAHRTAHSVARDFGHEEVFQLLKERTPEDLKMALACELGDEAVFQEFLSRHPDASTEIPETPLHRPVHTPAPSSGPPESAPSATGKPPRDRNRAPRSARCGAPPASRCKPCRPHADPASETTPPIRSCGCIPHRRPGAAAPGPHRPAPPPSECPSCIPALPSTAPHPAGPAGSAAAAPPAAYTAPALIHDPRRARRFRRHSPAGTPQPPPWRRSAAASADRKSVFQRKSGD